jgi:hypothetical protein
MSSPVHLEGVTFFMDDSVYNDGQGKQYGLTNVNSTNNYYYNMR